MHLGAPRDATVITINEADALVWSIVDRLRRPNELRSRILTGTDSAACCGAIAKGRSRSRRLNARCIQIAAALFCGRVELFLSWLSTHINPADEPSRWWEEVRKAKEAFGIDVPVVVPRTPAAWAAPQYFALLLCGGRARDGDVRDCKPSHRSSADLLDAGYRKRRALDVSRGYCVITFASPPCCSCSAVRHVPLKGGRGMKPLRLRTHPWHPCRDNFSR